MEAQTDRVAFYVHVQSLTSFVTVRVQAMYILFESASGYGLFEVVEAEEIGSVLEEVCSHFFVGFVVLARFVALYHIHNVHTFS